MSENSSVRQVLQPFGKKQLVAGFSKRGRNNNELQNSALWEGWGQVVVRLKLELGLGLGLGRVRVGVEVLGLARLRRRHTVVAQEPRRLDQPEVGQG